MLSERVRSWRWWPAVFLGALIVLAIWGEVRSTSPVAATYQAVQGQRYDRSLAEAAPSAPSSDDRVAEYTLWLARLTAVLAVATGLLWLETRRAIIDTRKASERELRAYVMVTLTGARVDPTKKGLAGIGIHNRGKTPAHDVIVYWVMSVAPHKAGKPQVDWYNSKASCPDESALLLGPDEYRGVESECDPFTEEEVRSILSGEETLYVVGRVEYIDAFEEKRTTRFCHLYSGLDLGKDGGKYGHYGNRAD